MRFMLLVKANRDSEAEVMPGVELLDAMGRFNEEMVKAGVMLMGEGLRSSARGARLRYSGARRTVANGPFDHVDQLVAGFWIIKVASLEEAVAWARRAPFEDGEVEIRPLFESEDFDQSSEAVRKEPALRAEVERQQLR